MAREGYPYGGQPRRRKKKGHKLYAFFVLLLGLLIIVLTVFLLFHIQRIEISGNTYCPDEQIAEAIQSDKYSVNSIYVCARYVLGYGKNLPCIESMRVRMGPPWVVKVEVKEKQIVGYLPEGDSYAYFDKEGLIVSKDKKHIKGIPRVEGIDAGDTGLYSQIESGNSRLFGEILEASQELRKYQMPIEKIVCKNNRIYIYVEKICVSVGNNVTSEKIAQIAPIIEELEGKEGTLHLENYAEGRETITFDIGEKTEEN